MPDFTKPFCYVIRDDAKDAKGYIPLAVFTDDPNAYETSWRFPEKERAELLALKMNTSMGRTPEDVQRIVDSSIAASLKQR